MNFTWVIIGLFTFIIIGVFHPIVIKTEYYFTKKVWPVFAAAGVLFLAVSLFVESVVFGPVLAVTGFTCLWSIKELFEQENRVKKGWFPANPNRK
ncbi:MAG: DUF4491 family protein [Firmicutes bacterium]|nr:DUF4491 family protein [Bacillota bacterium]